MIKIFAMLLLMSFLVVGCDSKTKEEAQDVILGQKLQALEKAKAVEQILLDAEKKKLESME